MKSRGRKYSRAPLSGIADYNDSEEERSPLSARSPLAGIVLCAGQGTRMKSGTAKVLHPVLGRPLCAYPIARALDAGASPVVAVIGFQGEQVTSALQKAFPGRPLRFAWQREQLGTAHAVQSAKAELEGYSGPILILYGDVPLLRLATLARLLEAYRSHRAALAIVTSLAADPTGYGRVVRTGGRISSGGAKRLQRKAAANQRMQRRRLRGRFRVPLEISPADAQHQCPARILSDRSGGDRGSEEK